MKLKTISALLLCTMLSGCGIYTSYRRPQDTLTDSLYRNVLQTDDTSALSTLKWEELFTDRYLQTLIRTGLEKNADLNVARLKVEEAQASLKTSRLQFLPSLDFSAEKTSSSAAGGTDNIGLSAGWELDIFGKQRNFTEKARYELEQSKAYRQAVQTRLVASIAENYYELLMLDRKLAVTRETLTLWDENVRVMKALKEAGKYSEAAVAQAEAGRLNAENSALSLEQQIYAMENSLSALTGTTPQMIERGSIDDIVFPERICEGLPLDMVNRRPDVLQAEYALASSFYNTNAARSSFYPSVTLGGTAGWTDNSGAVVTDPGQWLAKAVGALTQPLFNHGKLETDLEIAKARQKEAEIEYVQTLLDAGVQVNNALSQYQYAVRSLELDKKETAALKSAVHSTQLLMKHGSTSYLEVLTAQQSLLNAQLAEVTDRFKEVQGVILLYHALGGGTD